jgi:hypothetical protein
MANKIQIKRSSTAGKAPVAADLDAGEFAINTNDGKLFLKKDDTTIVDVLVGRTITLANQTSYAINFNLYDKVIFGAQTSTLNPVTVTGTGTPSSGQTLWITIIGSVSVTFSATNFEASTVALPTSSTTRLDVGFIYNTSTSKWRCVAVA